MRRPRTLLQAVAVAAGVAAGGFGVAAAAAASAPAQAPGITGTVPTSTTATATGTAATDTTATTPTGPMVVPPAAPVLDTAGVGAITTSGATVNGSVNAESLQSEYWVQYGPTAAYGEQTTATSAGADTSAHSISVVLTGLPPDTAFHYRIVAQNADGTVSGSDGTFTTDATAPVLSRLAIVADTSYVSLSGSAGVKSACLGGTSCSGAIVLTHDGVTIGTRETFTLSPHATEVVQVPVDVYGRKLLMANPSGITVMVTIFNGDRPLAHRHVTLEPARPAGHHDRLRPLS